MTEITARRRFPRSFVIVVFGPLVGALTVFAWMMVAAVFDPPPGDDVIVMLGMLALVVIAFGWMAGLLPAILAAIAWKFVEPRVHGWRRVASALVIGAVTSMLAAWPIFIFYFRATQITPQGMAMLAGIGAVAMAATALPGKKSA